LKKACLNDHLVGILGAASNPHIKAPHIKTITLNSSEFSGAFKLRLSLQPTLRKL
jgi:hypothetical protein